MYNSAMRQADRYVPICDVEKETHHLVILESPPPYRQNLQIDVATLTGLLGMAGAGDDQLKLGFERRQNIVRAAPTHAGQLGATTKETQFKEEKDQSPKQIVFDPHRQELRLTISYPDNETKTPTAAAKNLSRRLTGTLSMVPATKYFTNFLEDLGEEPIGGRAAEAASHMARIVSTATGFSIAYGILLVRTSTPHPWEALGIIVVADLLDRSLDLNSTLKLMKGMPVDKKRISSAMAIAEKPLRALYPVSLVHECLLPTARILAHNTIAPTQLLKANEK